MFVVVEGFVLCGDCYVGEFGYGDWLVWEGIDYVIEEMYERILFC